MIKVDIRDTDLDMNDLFSLMFQKIINRGGVAQMRHLYEAVNNVLKEKDFVLSFDGEHSLRSRIEYAAKLGYVPQSIKGNRGWRITKDGINFLNKYKAESLEDRQKRKENRKKRDKCFREISVVYNPPKEDNGEAINCEEKDKEVIGKYERQPYQKVFRDKLVKRAGGERCEILKDVFPCMGMKASHTLPVSFITKLVESRRMNRLIKHTAFTKEEYWEALITDEDNGFLLCNTMDGIYDDGYMTVNSETGEIKFSEDLIGVEWNHIKSLITDNIIMNDGKKIFTYIHEKYIFRDSKKHCRTSDEFVEKLTKSDLEFILLTVIDKNHTI